jgi:hypothetical protein
MTKRTEPEGITIRQFCETYGPGVTTTYALLKAGKIRAVKVGRATFIVAASAREWWAGLQATTEPVHKSVHNQKPNSGGGRRKTAKLRPGLSPTGLYDF